MKTTAILLSVTAIALTSCTTLDPEYAEYKKQKEAEAAGQGQFGGAGDPYGAPAANPYGVPGQGLSDVGTYTPQTPAAPYQPLPGVNAHANGNPYAPPAVRSGFPTIPGPAAGGTPHVVVKGDTLSGLSRQYGTTAEAIRAANGMTGDTIVLGRTLQIPRN
ncbi:MAG: LysM peptidoglycan-binding domain-containing protein [Akkermansiaceae bacterium]|nr:LysM peptidoglycan-binding domain-containing protein [Akkermansiaceae bacterium]